MLDYEQESFFVKKGLFIINKDLKYELRIRVASKEFMEKYKS